MMGRTIPVHIVAGFLGSGKTTALRRAIDAYQLRGLRPVVIMNELGDVNLDGEALGASGEPVPTAEMLGGCICCTIRGDIALRLQELVREYEPDAVFIETTGVANPMELMDAVTEASLYLPVTLESVATVVDAAFVAGEAGKPTARTMRLLRDQVRCATRIALNKTDRVSPEAADRAEAQVREWNPVAPLVRTAYGALPAAWWFERGGGARSERDAASSDAHACGPDCGHDHHGGHDVRAHGARGHHDSHEHVSAYTRYFQAPVDSLAFESFVKSLPDNVYRAKGVVTFTDTASRFLFQYAYKELDFIRIQPQGHVNDVAVFLGEQFTPESIEAGLAALERPASVRAGLREAYDRHAEERDGGGIQDWKVAERDRFLAALREAKAESLLEIGAGPGRDSLFFAENGLRVTAVDLSAEMVRLCREKGLDARQMDMAELDFPDDCFDAVYALNCLLHIPKAELDSVLREIRRVLKPGGMFYMGVYGGIDSEGVWEQDVYEPKRFFAMYEDDDMREAVGRVFEVAYFGTVKMADGGRQPHFQSMILRKSANLW